MNVVYDAGVLIAADRGAREVWADHRRRLEGGTLPLTTAPVVAQASRSSRQVRLRRFLQGCEVTGFGAESAHAVGELLAKARTSDVVDAHLVLVTAVRGAILVTSDHDDFEALPDSLPTPVKVRPLNGA